MLSIAERLRKQIRAGQPLPKAIESSFSNAWPSIRNTHLILLLFAIIAWAVGTMVVAQTIRWLGISLVAGTLTSLFVTMVFSRSLMSLIFGIDAAQAWVNEHKWLLDI
jgi:preprotein translocase subunit SecD